MILEILEFSFMQRALTAGVAVAVICSIIGLFLVLRRHSLFGDALSHMAFGGIAIGMYTNIYPMWTAFIVSILAALGITKLRQSTNIPPDSAVAVLLSSGLALGVVLVSLSNGFSIDLFSFLFGSILLVSVEDTLMILAIAVTILSIVLILYRKLMYITFDEEQAKVSGLQVTKLNYLFVSTRRYNCNCINALSRNSTNLFINCNSYSYCYDVWKRFQENNPNFCFTIGIFCSSRNTYLLYTELGSRRNYCSCFYRYIYCNASHKIFY